MIQHIKYFITGLILCFFQISFAQQSKTGSEQSRIVDSLKKVLLTAKEACPEPCLGDTGNVNTLNALSLELKNIGDYEKAIQYGNDALVSGKKVNFQKGIAKAYFNLGVTYMEQGNYGKALENQLASLKIYEEIGDKNGIANSYNNIGNVYDQKGNYDKALGNHFIALKIRQAIGNKKAIAVSYNNIALSYWKQKNYGKALENHFASLKIKKETGDKRGIAGSYNNIGLIFENQGNYDKALENFLAALKINKEIGNKARIASNYNNIGSVYYSQGNYDKALENFVASLKIREEVGDKKGIAASHSNIGSIYIKQKKFSVAKTELEEGLALSKEIGFKEGIQESYGGLTGLDSALGNWKGAYQYHKLYSQVKESIFNKESSNQIAEMNTKYETELKEQQITLLNRDKDKQAALAAAESKRQLIIIWSVAGGLFLVIVFALFVVRSLRITRGQKQVIELKSKETEEQKKIIEEKNKDITDSINYAKRIQKAMLPHRKDIWAAFPQSFVLFKPKDIVSGDFYFFHNNNQSAFIAAADCTGHGVPGAFMSMIGSGKLNDAVSESNDLSVILSLLNKGVKSTLKQSETDQNATRDGMDIALCSVDSDSRMVKYAGANRPIWIIRKGETIVEEIKATKKAIGGFTEDSQHFECHEIKFEPGDTFYIATDGFADTFGGQEQKKLTTKRFKEILVSIQDKSLKEQGQYLESFIEDWKGGIEQIDDILVIGVRL